MFKKYSLMALIGFMLLGQGAGATPQADSCVGRLNQITKLADGSIEFKSFDQTFRTLGGETETEVMLKALTRGLIAETYFLNSVHVHHRDQGVIYVDTVEYNDMCQLVLAPHP